MTTQAFITISPSALKMDQTNTRRKITVGELRKIIAALPEDTVVCVPMADANKEDAFYARKAIVYHYFDAEGYHSELCLYSHTD